MHCRKDNKTNAKNNANCTKNHPQRVSHERGFRILKCIWAGLWARWAPRPCPHSPKTLPNQDFCSFVSRLVWFVIDSWCIFPKIARRCWCSFLCFREWTFNETCKWNKQWTPFQKGTVAGLRAALLDNYSPSCKVGLFDFFFFPALPPVLLLPWTGVLFISVLLIKTAGFEQ